MILSTDAGKAFVKIQHPFMIETQQTGYRGNTPQHRKGHTDMTTQSNITLGGEELKAFPRRSGTRQGHPLPSLLFNMALEVLARATRRK